MQHCAVVAPHPAILQEVACASAAAAAAARPQPGPPPHPAPRPRVSLPTPLPSGADNDSGSKRRRPDKGGGDKGSGRGKARAVGRRPQHVAAADEARRKAARAGGDGQPRTHVKCFFAGLQHGAWLAADALADRARLAAAVSRAFADDGVACSSEAATIVLVGADQQAAEFPGGSGAGGAGGEVGGAGGGGTDGKWEAAAKAAVRVYVR